MAFYKYVNFEVLNYILNGSIRFTQAGAFNDPFELALEVFNPYGGDRSNLNLRFDTLAQPRCTSLYTLQDEMNIDDCNDLFTRELRTNLDRDIGFLCLTKNPSSHLMWAHYADSYKGALVEFDEDHDFFSGAFEISYIKERPRIHIDYFLGGSPISIAELCIKSDEWAYEKEWRVCRPLTDCTSRKQPKGAPKIHTQSIPDGAIKNIILGERTKLSDVKHVFKKLKNTNIKIQLAILQNWSYEFRFEDIKYNLPFQKSLPPISPITAPIFLEEKGVFGQTANWIHSNHPMNETIKWRL